MLVGVTGNIGSGKSAFLLRLKALGYKIKQADIFVSKLLGEKEVVDRVREEFGSTVCLNDKVDKELLSNIVFSDKEKLLKLERIVHPYVEEMIKSIKHNEKIVFVEVPLLFETGMENLFDKVILINTPLEKAKERALKKGIGESEFLRRYNAQEPNEVKVEKSDIVVNGDVDLRVLKEDAERIANGLEASL